MAPVANETEAALVVDLALVLAVDCSSSVDSGDYRLQMDGIAAALRNPELETAIASGRHKRIALMMLHWSRRDAQYIALPWRILSGGGSIEAAARDISRVERNWKPGGTGLAAAIRVAAANLLGAPFAADRRVIDVSGDGEDNEDGNPALERNTAVANGIVINGLPVMSGSGRIVSYYRSRVIGGPGSFLVPAFETKDFAEAMAEKLLREVRQPVS
jgi:hypothetical protein